MMVIVIWTAVLVVLRLLLGLIAADQAPTGYQDEQGFHYGVPSTSQGRDSYPVPHHDSGFLKGRPHGLAPASVVAASANHA